METTDTGDNRNSFHEEIKAALTKVIRANMDDTPKQIPGEAQEMPEEAPVYRLAIPGFIGFITLPPDITPLPEALRVDNP